jgi:hypothetical protein
MNVKIFAAAAFVSLGLPFAAGAQGVVGGAAEGAHEGDHAAGQVGAVFGGGVAGLLGVDQRPRFRAYVKHEHRNSYAYHRPVAVGAELPAEGVTYYEVPSEYGLRNYRFAVVNDQTVLVDPRTHRIVEVTN